MFYDCEIGPAGYIAPVGKVEGELTRKRQFKIKNGIMEYALESSVVIRDDLLQQELSHTSDEKMKSIIATIQKEQNIIIRNENTGTLIIQGVAGSGKTSIALHRIAYLLYRFKDKLSAKNVTIISPNRVFGDYISNVLPELGEEPIYEVSLADIARVQLEGVVDFETDKDPLAIDDAGWVERVRFKSTLGFVKLLDEFIEEMSNHVFEPVDYSYGSFIVKAETLSALFQRYSRYPVRRRLKALNRMLKVKNTLALYKEFYKRNDLSKMLVMPAKKRLEWSDVYPFLYLHAFFVGLKESGIIKHLVIDEMQDYTPIQYAVINLLFKCQKTILGDFGQLINPNHLHNLEDLRQLYDGAEFVELSKSYRSTYEIISFAKQIKSMGRLEAFERHGEPPAIIKCLNNQDELRKIGNGICAFLKKLIFFPWNYH